MGKQKISGIYKIINIENGKYYIGSAVDIKNRWKTHKRLLKNNKHYNNHLQSAYNKYGNENFLYEVIEETENLIEREQFWLDKLNANDNSFGYNKRIIATSNLGIKLSDSTREKLRISHIGNKQSKETIKKISESQYKKICQFDINGNYLNTFNSLQEAAKFLNKSYTTSITMCLNGKISTAFGYAWCHELDRDNFKIREKNNGKTIEITDNVTGVTYIFKTMKECCDTLKIPVSIFYTKSNKKYVWKIIK